MKKFLGDKIHLLFIASAFCTLIIPFVSGVSPIWALISIPLFCIAIVIDLKYPNFPKLHQSAANCDNKKLLKLISSDVDINSLDKYGQTAIIQIFTNKSSLINKIKYINTLLDNGFNINEIMVQKNDRASILDVALSLNCAPDIIDLLRKHGGKTSEELKAEEK